MEIRLEIYVLKRFRLTVVRKMYQWRTTEIRVELLKKTITGFKYELRQWAL